MPSQSQSRGRQNDLDPLADNSAAFYALHLKIADDGEPTFWFSTERKDFFRT